MPYTVLVTGGSGHVASHCVVKLLNAGHDVRTTVRSKSKANNLNELLSRLGATQELDRLSLYEADLSSG